MKVKICIVRHGQTTQNSKHLIQGRSNFPLNETGIMQAHTVGKYLANKGENFDCIYCSPLDRAYDTAKIIATEIGYTKEIIKKECFIEREFGDAEGRPVSTESFIDVLDDTCPNMEKSYEIQKRVKDGLIENIKDYKSILIVSHSHAIKGLLSAIDISIPFDLPMVNCAISYLIYENNELKFDNININPFI